MDGYSFIHLDDFGTRTRHSSRQLLVFLYPFPFSFTHYLTSVGQQLSSDASPQAIESVGSQDQPILWREFFGPMGTRGLLVEDRDVVVSENKLTVGIPTSTPVPQHSLGVRTPSSDNRAAKPDMEGICATNAAYSASLATEGKSLSPVHS